MVPELGVRRRPLSSGLNARDQIACVTQASTKCRKAQHDDARFRHSLRKVNGDIRGDDQAVCFQSGCGSCPRQESVVRMTCAASALVSARGRLATSQSRSRVATRYDKLAANYLTFIKLGIIRICAALMNPSSQLSPELLLKDASLCADCRLVGNQSVRALNDTPYERISGKVLASSMPGLIHPQKCI
jgi:hypothetical protein